jgi:hypothetical protein
MKSKIIEINIVCDTALKQYIVSKERDEIYYENYASLSKSLQEFIDDYIPDNNGFTISSDERIVNNYSVSNDITIMVLHCNQVSKEKTELFNQKLTGFVNAYFKEKINLAK